MRSLAALFLTGLVLLAPAAAAQTGVSQCTQQCDPKAINGPTIKRGNEPTSVILYGHFRDILQNAPLNTQRPDPDREPDINAGFAMPTVVLTTNTPADLRYKPSEFQLYSSPGLIEYRDEGWRIHQEPGLASELLIDGDELTLYWYLSAHSVPTQNSHGNPNAVAIMPQVAVYARLETGRHPFHGRLLAESDDFDTTAPGNERRVNMITIPGQPDVYEFVVKLKVLEPIIPDKAEDDGFTLYVNPYQIKTEKREGTQVEQSDWRLRTGPKFLPRLIVPAAKLMETKASSMNLFDDRLFLRWSFTSALGSYDMRDAAIDLRSVGDNIVDERAIDHIILKKSIDHDGHFKPVNSTWAIDYVKFPLKDGDYEMVASIPNLQDTYLLEQTFRFTVKDGVPQAPGPGNAAANAAVGTPAGKAQSDTNDVSFPASLAALVVLAVVAVWRRRA